jgi:hypothetical protein
MSALNTIGILIVIVFSLMSKILLANNNKIDINIDGGQRCFTTNGVQFRPNTAGSWDPDARRGHSRHGDENWSIDIFGARGKLGLDFNNAHVGKGGLYHYHGIAVSLTTTSGSSLVGYAGDGFEMHYIEREN